MRGGWRHLGGVWPDAAFRLGVVGNPDQLRHIGFGKTKVAPEASRVLSMRIGDADAAL